MTLTTERRNISPSGTSESELPNAPPEQLAKLPVFCSGRSLLEWQLSQDLEVIYWATIIVRLFCRGCAVAHIACNGWQWTIREIRLVVVPVFSNLFRSFSFLMSVRGRGMQLRPSTSSFWSSAHSEEHSPMMRKLWNDKSVAPQGKIWQAPGHYRRSFECPGLGPLTLYSPAWKSSSIVSTWNVRQAGVGSVERQELWFHPGKWKA